jgi:gamma-glutamyltranspeptidase/glutathione hydrolase
VEKAGHKKMPPFGFIPMTVPGAPAAWAALSERFGRLSLSECLGTAIGYAENGYPVSPTLGVSWRKAFEIYKANLEGDEFAPWFSTFAPNGRAPETGQMAYLPHHARTLREIGETGAKSFYSGALSDEITKFCARHGGYLTKEDLQGFKPEWVAPISANYRGYDVWEIPPNGQGIVALMALSIMREFECGNKDDALAYHRQFEAIKLAFAAGKRHITDPRHMAITPEEMLSDGFIAKMRTKIADTAAEPEIDSPNSHGTVYLATADGEGNMVSFIQSNYMGFGSGIVIEGTGIAMQNRGYDFSLDPGHINHLAGGKKTYHTIIPGFLTKDGKAVGPFGVMGGYMQPQGHLQSLRTAWIWA